MRTRIVVAVAAAAVSAAAGVLAGGEKPVAYPADYRQWTHVKSMVLLPGHALANPFEGIHHVYANDAAVAGLKSGTYKDGAVFAFDLLEYKVADEAGTEGARKLLGVMEKDAGRFAATGGWGFEGFAGDSRTERLVTDGGANCFACHRGAEKTAYVFSKMRP